jgi:murein L,D-transpeptidase YafK
MRRWTVLALMLAAIAFNRVLIDRARASIVQTTAPLPPLVENPRIVVEKSARKLTLYSGDRVVATYRVGLGFSPVGPKFREGDGRTPEGELRVVTRNEKSRFRKFLGLSYPRPSDVHAMALTPDEREAIAVADHAKTQPPWNTPLGGAVGIHGHGGGRDWTSGCVAVDDDAIDALWDVVPLGTPVTILP